MIVISIRLAFGIDAWWDQMRERREERESLLLPVSDLDASVEQLADYLK